MAGPKTSNSLIIQSDHTIPKHADFVGPRFVEDHNLMATLLKNMRGSGTVDVRNEANGIVIHGRRTYVPPATNTFLQITKTNPGVIKVSAGYGCYAGTFTELSDGDLSGVGLFGSNTVYDYDGASGTWYTLAKIDFATGTWTFEMNSTVDTLPVNTDSVQYYILGKVTVEEVDNPIFGLIQEITAVEQYWFGGWCIYENRV